MESIANTCDRCNKYFLVAALRDSESCPHCGQMTWKMGNKEFIFDVCIFCKCKHFYHQKNFNPVAGLSLIVLGAILVPWTYGLSLPVLFLVDLLLRRWIPDMAVCYRCRAEFRGFPLPVGVQGFNHHQAAMFEEGYSSH